jgi:catechol 2,3-dioxygenase
VAKSVVGESVKSEREEEKKRRREEIQMGISASLPRDCSPSFLLRVFVSSRLRGFAFAFVFACGAAAMGSSFCMRGDFPFYVCGEIRHRNLVDPGRYDRAMPITTDPSAIHPDVRIGHVHLKVSDLDRAIAFYRGVLGFEITLRLGTQAAFLSAGGYHHHIGLNTWESAGVGAPAPGTTGLYHVAILYPSRAELADALRELVKANVQLTGAADHGVSEAIYLQDPDGNGVELYWDRPRDQWPKSPTGELTMYTRPLDLKQLLYEAH